MLIRRPILERIERGEITLAFRRWLRPTAKADGTLRTAVGVLSIESVKRVHERDIPESDVRRAGFESKRELIGELRMREGGIYRIALSYAGVDPRIALRRRVQLSDTEFDTLHARLRRLDLASRRDP